MIADNITEGLSIDETVSIFEDGYGVKKAAQMLKEKQQVQKQLAEERNAAI